MRQNDDIIKRGRLWDVGLLPISGATGEKALNFCGKIKLKDSKTSTVVWTAGEHFEHVSISPVHKYTMPTWDDMCALKDIFFYEAEEAYQVHPPKSEYINVMENCLHLWRLTNGARITDIAGKTFKTKKKEVTEMRIKLDEGAYMPERAHTTDAGLDLKTPEDFFLTPGGSHTINTGVHVEIPAGCVGFLKSKSGLNVKHGITSEGVIDEGYTGAICVKLYNHHPFLTHEFKAGEKITQLVILPVVIPDKLEVVDELADTERGAGGFGSTGA